MSNSSSLVFPSCASNMLYPMHPPPLHTHIQTHTPAAAENFKCSKSAFVWVSFFDSAHSALSFFSPVCGVSLLHEVQINHYKT